MLLKCLFKIGLSYEKIKTRALCFSPFKNVGKKSNIFFKPPFHPCLQETIDVALYLKVCTVLPLSILESPGNYPYCANRLDLLRFPIPILPFEHRRGKTD